MKITLISPARILKWPTLKGPGAHDHLLKEQKSLLYWSDQHHVTLVLDNVLLSTVASWQLFRPSTS